MMMKFTLAILLSCLGIAVSAQTQPQPSRQGFVFGAALGLSSTIQQFPDKSQTNTDFGFDLKVGYMLKPNVAILLSSNVSGYDYEGIGRPRKRDFGILAPCAQYWIREKFWIMGGIGIGIDAPIFFDIQDPDQNPEETKYFGGFGAIGAIGYDIFQGSNYTLDLKARITTRSVKLAEGKTTGFAPSILFGINFY